MENQTIPSNQTLKTEAKAILQKKGFKDNEIYEDFWIKNHQIDIVGWNPTHRVAIELKPHNMEGKNELKKFFDEVIYLPITPITRPTPSKPKRRTPRLLANMKLVLTQKGRVVFEVPLSRQEWQRDFLEDEMADSEEDLQHFSRLYSALSHRNRLMMMKLLMEEKNMTKGFAEFIRDLDLNPKLVWENTKKLGQCGLLSRNGDGRYRCSEFGEASFMVSLVLKHIREIFESMEGR